MSEHNCIAKNNGSMKCWGRSFDGQLGLGVFNDRGDVPDEMGSNLPFVQIGDGLKIDQVSIAYINTCVHLTTNQVKCWGKNSYGQIGLGITDPKVGSTISTTPDKLSFVNLGTESTAIKVFCGYFHTCVLFANKKIKCFGDNQFGEIGWEGVDVKGFQPDDMGDNLPFVNLGTGAEVEFLYTGGLSTHSCVILVATQMMKCWGHNLYHQLGLGDTDDRGKAANTMGDKLPTVDLGSVQTVKQITLLQSSTCALRTDDVLLCWGLNDKGQLGIGSTSEVVAMGHALIATSYDSGKKIKQIIGGDYYLCILYDDSITLKCIGKNSKGQLGQGDTVNRGDSPSSTFPNISVIDLGAGSLQISLITPLFNAVCVKFVDLSVKCFGDGSNGKLGNGKTDSIGDESGEMGSSLPFVDLGFLPTTAPSNSPTISPSKSPTGKNPTKSPTKNPTNKSTKSPVTSSPTKSPDSVCNYKAQVKCDRDPFCVWNANKRKCNELNCTKLILNTDCNDRLACSWNEKKSKCIALDCTKILERPECIAFSLCDWKKGSCRFKPKQ